MKKSINFYLRCVLRIYLIQCNLSIQFNANKCWHVIILIFIAITKIHARYLFLFIFSVRLCLFCVIIRFVHVRHTGQWPPSWKVFHPRFYPLLFLSYLNSCERASISLFMFSAKQGNYWYQFYNVFGMMQLLTGRVPRTLTHLELSLLLMERSIPERMVI